MSDLLIHSMAELAPIIVPLLERANSRNIVEIGAEFGGMSKILADHCETRGGTLTSIDPEPKHKFVEWANKNKSVKHVPKPSLEAIPELSAPDAWVIDGDHNYYTVYHELLAIDALNRDADKPLLIFLHDVSWPCARRDFYYAPKRIPEKFRHDYTFSGGVSLDSEQILEGRGMRGMGHFAWALEAGGPQNGVLTAIEDFMLQADNAHRPLVFAQVPAVFGLGVIFDARAEWAEDAAGMILPYHHNEVIAKLEVNRLRNWLAVIDAQDREAERVSTV